MCPYRICIPWELLFFLTPTSHTLLIECHISMFEYEGRFKDVVPVMHLFISHFRYLHFVQVDEESGTWQEELVARVY